MDYTLLGLSIVRQMHVFVLLLSTFVHIKAAIYIEDGPSDIRVQAGKDVTFSCTPDEHTMSYGQPEIRWYKDDRAINMDLLLTGKTSSTRGGGYTADKKYLKDPLNNSLHIFGTTTADSGHYTCVVTLFDETDTASAQLIVEDVPDPPMNVRLSSCHSRLAQIQWDMTSENFSPVIQFIIQYNTSFDPGIWHVAKTQLPRTKYYQRIAVSPWGNYSFRVIAQNKVGYSEPSAPTEGVCRMPPDVPHHNPRQVCTRNVKPHMLAISWELMPLSEHNAPGFYYQVKWRRRDSSSAANRNREYSERTFTGNVSQMTIYDQPIYKAYEIYVLALNSIGEAVSPPKMYIGFSSEDIPLEVPKNFRLSPHKPVTDITADFEWDTVSTGAWRMQGFFRGYKIQYWKTEAGIARSLREHSIIYREPDPCGTTIGNVDVPDGHQASHSGDRRHSHGNDVERRRVKRDISKGHIYNLWPYTNVTARIVVLNGKYEGPPSSVIRFTTSEGETHAVTQFAVLRRGSSHFELSWEPPYVINGKLVGYDVVYQVTDPGQFPRQGVSYNNPNTTRSSLTGLLPDHSYRITIYAKNGQGRGESYTIEDHTLPDGPPVAPNFTTSNISKRSINVTWVPSTNGNPGSVFFVHHRRLGGDLGWEHSDPIRERSWAVVSGLIPGVIYEMRVIASNGELGDNLQETYSAIERIRLDMKRAITEPSFKMRYINDASFGVVLSDDTGITQFYVQFKYADENHWRTTPMAMKDRMLVIDSLLPGKLYDVRVVTTGPLGSATSGKQQFIAGKDPDALAATGERNAAAPSIQTSVVYIIMCCLTALKCEDIFTRMFSLNFIAFSVFYSELYSHHLEPS